MYKLIILLIMMLMGCSDPGSSGLDVNPGEGVFTIKNIEYQAEATFGTRVFGEDEVEQITLRASDTVFIDILCEDFQKGVTTWDGEFWSEEDVHVFMIHRDLGGGFGPRSGYFIITKRTESYITGIFNMELQDFASSCYNCPDDLVWVEGEFNVELN